MGCSERGSVVVDVGVATEPEEDIRFTYADAVCREDGTTYGFPEVEVKEVGLKGVGVFATKNLPAGFVIPVFGDPAPVDSPSTSFTWVYSFGPSAGRKVCSDPRRRGGFQVTGNGLGVALLLNWPGQGEEANCVFGFDCVHSIRKLKKGEELLIRYWRKGDSDSFCVEGMRESRSLGKGGA